MHKTTDAELNRRVGLRRVEDPQASPSAPVPVPAPDYAGLNAYAADPVLTACLDATLDEAAEEELKTLGAYWGSAEAQEVARIASSHGPSLRRTDAEGRRIDQLEIHPAYHALMNRSIGAGLTSSAWEDGEDRRHHRLRAATLFLTAQCERGHLLPVCATHAAVAALAHAADLEAELFPLIASRRYDRRPVPLAEKDGVAVTLALAEPGAGLDRAAVATRGEPAGGDRIRVTGEKAFVAAPASDIALVLVRTQEGPTAVVVPRFAPENAGAIRVEMLAAVPGLAGQALASIEFRGATGRLVGEPGRGLLVLRDVRTLTQLDTAIIAAAILRAAVSRAVHHARYHQSFGRSLLAHPLHARILADLALDAAAHTALAIRLASAFDLAFERDGDHALARIVTPAARVAALASAMSVATEVCAAIGPFAAVADHPAARLAADARALALWDGSATEAALDLVAQVQRDPAVLADALAEIATDLGAQNADLVDDVARLGERAVSDPALARAFAERLAMVAAAAAMRRNLPRVVADAYVATRLRERYRTAPGALDSRFDAAALIEFIAPED